MERDVRQAMSCVSIPCRSCSELSSLVADDGGCSRGAFIVLSSAIRAMHVRDSDADADADAIGVGC